MSITKEQRDCGYAQFKVFRDWVRETILVPADNGLDGPIMFLPLAQSVPDYRDVVLPDT